jgi:para-nitrobenzyl esterase
MKRTSLLLVLGIAVAAPTLMRAAITDPVRIDAGQVAGTTQEGVRVYKGIPFAAPPIGDLRWRAPQPVARWTGVRQADRYGNVCVQGKGVGRVNVATDLPDSPKTSEDCLYLNVWTAANNASDRRPVMVWLYGGAYTEGSGSSPHNEGFTLAKKGVVLVSFNYRVGPFGFFSHPELTAESGHNASGNQALLDTIATLRWVKTNIAAFGGDPDNVTIFGESAGAAMSAALVGSPQAKGLFKRAISESGAWMGLSMGRIRSRADAERPPAARGGRPGGPAAAAPAPKSLAELRALSAEDVSRTLRGAGMIADGWIIPEDESITFAEGRQNAVDVLVGSNKDEGAYNTRPVTAEAWQQRVRSQWGDLADQYLKLYPGNTDAEATNSSLRSFADNMHWHMRLYADAMAKKGQKAWLYYFTHEPQADPGKPNQHATHTTEIPYVFNTLTRPRVFPDNSSPELTSKSKFDIELADRVSSYWVNFARTGDPNGKGLPQWPAFTDKATSKAALLGPAAPYPSAEQMAIYDKLYARQMATLLKTAATP